MVCTWKIAMDTKKKPIDEKKKEIAVKLIELIRFKLMNFAYPFVSFLWPFSLHSYIVWFLTSSRQKLQSKWTQWRQRI